jgi:hypothetical protein
LADGTVMIISHQGIIHKIAYAWINRFWFIDNDYGVVLVSHDRILYQNETLNIAVVELSSGRVVSGPFEIPRTQFGPYNCSFYELTDLGLAFACGFQEAPGGFGNFVINLDSGAISDFPGVPLSESVRMPGITRDVSFEYGPEVYKIIRLDDEYLIVEVVSMNTSVWLYQEHTGHVWPLLGTDEIESNMLLGIVR